MRLRPYKTCDADNIIDWLKDETTFFKWGGKLFGSFPINADIINEKYFQKNGGCVEPDNFYPWTALDDDGAVIGHFIMRYTDGNPKQMRFGWVIVDDSRRGKGYGSQMLQLGLNYAFDILKADKVTIGVFENNESAHHCYQKLGFSDKKIREGDPWNVIEMEILKKDFYRNDGE